MKIGIVGLGLIGGSLAKAIRATTRHEIIGYDIREEIVMQALKEGVIDATGIKGVTGADITFICLYPQEAVEFINTHEFSGIVCDTCGVKKYVYDHIDRTRVRYVGTHPMAGREISGYSASDAALFDNASLILVREEDTDKDALRRVHRLARELPFETIVITTAKEHDRVIAYTSQLAHVVSSAYIKSDTAEKYDGYSAGSFQDMTRVACLAPKMWTELFLMNKEPLIDEITKIVLHLEEFRLALQTQDEQTLYDLLKAGSDRKKMLNRSRRD